MELCATQWLERIHAAENNGDESLCVAQAKLRGKIELLQMETSVVATIFSACVSDNTICDYTIARIASKVKGVHVETSIHKFFCVGFFFWGGDTFSLDTY